ncbi:hypothetical protein OGAPHI_005620 [Ogataea philodendri]|uniref:Uncharacterized protein n=1 Tax=Ogataea philodendri TaxID=1378263 RepID=A0A9P8NYQ9_9ASCO|nr:uncharacterized protein OGAPHI_005620 [Ogataea philodendri]KAH3662368.1 hypothetical protein OGAPHI_005620 [Ogataea philodendri]
MAVSMISSWFGTCENASLICSSAWASTSGLIFLPFCLISFSARALARATTTDFSANWIRSDPSSDLMRNLASRESHDVSILLIMASFLFCEDEPESPAICFRLLNTWLTVRGLGLNIRLCLERDFCATRPMSPYSPMSSFNCCIERPVPEARAFISRVSPNPSSSPSASELVNILKVLLGQLERLGGQVRDVLANQAGWLNSRLWNLLHQESLERLNTRSQIRRVERNRDSLQWNTCESSLQVDRLWLGQGLLGDLVHNLTQMLGNLLERHHLLQFDNVDLLHLKHIQCVGQRVKSSQVTSGNVLLVLHVEVDNLQQPAGLFADVLNNESQGRVVESEGGSVLVDILKDLFRSEFSIFVNSFKHHGNVVLSNGSTLWTSKVDGQLVRVVLHDVQNRETVVVDEVLVGSVPHLLGNLRGVVQIHTHTLFLGTLTSEHKGRNWLVDLGLSSQDDFIGLNLSSLDLDDLSTVDHSNVLELSGEHTVGDGTRQVSVGSKHLRNVDRVEVTRNSGVNLVRTWCFGNQCSRQWNRVRKLDRLLDWATVSAQVVDNRVSVRNTGSVRDLSNLLDLLRWHLVVNRTSGLNRRVDILVLEVVDRLASESQSLTQEVNWLGAKVEPLLRLQNSNVLVALKTNLHWSLGNLLESVFEVGVRTSVEESGGHLHDGLASSVDGTNNLDSLTGRTVDNRNNFSIGRNLITSLEQFSTWLHTVSVGQVNQLKNVSINSFREDSLHDGSPTNNNGEIHWGQLVSSNSWNEEFTRVTDSMSELCNRERSDLGQTTIDFRANVEVKVNRNLGTEPHLPVELLDSIVSTLGNFLDRSETVRFLVGVEQLQSNWGAISGSVFNQFHLDQRVGSRDSDNLLFLTLDLTKQGNDGLRWGIWMEDSDLVMLRRSQHLLDRVLNKVVTLNRSVSRDEGVSPVQFRTG